MQARQLFAEFEKEIMQCDNAILSFHQEIEHLYGVANLIEQGLFFLNYFIDSNSSNQNINRNVIAELEAIKEREENLELIVYIELAQNKYMDDLRTLQNIPNQIADSQNKIQYIKISKINIIKKYKKYFDDIATLYSKELSGLKKQKEDLQKYLQLHEENKILVNKLTGLYVRLPLIKLKISKTDDPVLLQELINEEQKIKEEIKINENQKETIKPQLSQFKRQYYYIPKKVLAEKPAVLEQNISEQEKTQAELKFFQSQLEAKLLPSISQHWAGMHYLQDQPNQQFDPNNNNQPQNQQNFCM